MYTAIQFSIFLINKPGVLAQVLGELAREKINIVAMTMMDSVEHGVLRLVVTQTAAAREILNRTNMQVNESEVLCITLPNKAGALAGIAAQLSKAHININYCYVTAGSHGGKTTGVLKVADLKKAMKTLEKSADRKAASEKTPSRPFPARRGR
jgi:hypothetical protein